MLQRQDDVVRWSRRWLQRQDGWSETMVPWVGFAWLGEEIRGLLTGRAVQEKREARDKIWSGPL